MNKMFNLLNKKKGQMTGVLMPIVMVAIILVVIAIVMAVGQQLLSDTAAGYTANTYEKNATTSMQSGLNKISDKFPLIGTVIVLVIVIGLLFMVFQYIRTR
jgi:carbon starvation protein CstA